MSASSETWPKGQCRAFSTEEALERFLLHQSRDEELEVLESHILACESCVTRLEDLEVWLAVTKLALNAALSRAVVFVKAERLPGPDANMRPIRLQPRRKVLCFQRPI
jgi:hypothetical protein